MKGTNGENALKGNLGDICKYQNFNNRILDEHGEEIGLDYAEEDGEGKNRTSWSFCNDMVVYLCFVCLADTTK